MNIRKLYRVNFFNLFKDSDSSINILKAIYFYHTTPLVKFCYHTVSLTHASLTLLINLSLQISYVIFLAVYSFFVLTDLHPERISACEGLVWAWSLTLIMEEIRQVTSATNIPHAHCLCFQVWVKRAVSLSARLASYFDSVWNRFDFMLYGLLIISIIIRYTLTEYSFLWARRIYAVNLAMFFLRFLHTFFVDRNIGPKVIMIRRMVSNIFCSF